MRRNDFSNESSPFRRDAGLHGRAMAVLAVLMLTFAWPAMAAEPLDDAMRDAVEQSVASLEQTMAAQEAKFEGIESVAVLPIQGESGARLTELMTVGVTKTSLAVMERSEIERLLAEHSFAGDEFQDLFAAKKDTVARLGEFVGVKAYLMGRIVSSDEREAGPDTISEVVLNVKLVNIETAQIVWADDVTGRSTRPSVAYQQNIQEQSQADEAMRRKMLIGGIVGAAAVIVLLAGAIAFSRKPPVESKSQRRSETTDLLKEDHALRTRLGAEGSKAQANLNQGRQKAHEAGNDAIADRMHTLDNRLGTVKRSVEQASFGAGAPENLDGGSVRRMTEFERALGQDLQTLTSRCETVSHSLVDDGEADVGKDLDRIEKDMTAFEQRFKERSDYLKGLL